jgi:hypothetical protein
MVKVPAPGRLIDFAVMLESKNFAPARSFKGAAISPGTDISANNN